MRLDIGDAGLSALAATPTAADRLGTVVLVPGYTGSKEDFRPLLAPLAEAGLHAVAIDQRGQYESPGSGDPDSYTVDRLASDLLRALSSLDEGPVHLVGHSFGGLVCRAAAITEPALIRSLVLMGSGPAGLRGQRRVGLELFLPLLDQYDLPAALDIVEAIQASQPQRRAPAAEAVAFARTRLLATDPAALRGMAAALMHEPDRTAALRSTGIPVLVLYGEGDDAWSPAVQADMARRLRAPCAVIPDSAHSPAVENPEPTALALLRFFSSIPA